MTRMQKRNNWQRQKTWWPEKLQMQQQSKQEVGAEILSAWNWTVSIDGDVYSSEGAYNFKDKN